MVRPSQYSPEIVDAICERMTNGQGLLKICTDPEMPGRVTVYRWLEANPDFKQRFARAREAQMDFYAEQILSIAFDESGDIILDQGKDGKTSSVANHAKVQRDRLKVDSLKWIASRLFPKRYGDKMELLGQSEEDKHFTISWEKVERVIVDPQAAKPPEPPRQIEYHKPEMPADLTEQDWSIMLEVLELIKRTVPTNDDSPPAEIFGLIKEALLNHFREPS